MLAGRLFHATGPITCSGICTNVAVLIDLRVLLPVCDYDLEVQSEELLWIRHPDNLSADGLS